MSNPLSAYGVDDTLWANLLAQMQANLSVATITAPGFAPTLPNDSTKYLNGVGSFAVPAAGASLTVEEVDTVPTVANVTTIIVPNGTLTDNGGGSVTFAPTGTGDVVGPAGATGNHLAVFDGATGKLLKDGGAANTGDVVGPGGATDGNMALFDGASGKLLKDGGAPAAGAPTTAKYVTTASDAGLSAEVAIPGLAGSPDILGAGGAGTSEEYDTSTTGLTWTASAPTTCDSNTTILSHLYMDELGDTNVRLGLKSWSPGTTFDARAKLSLGSEGTPLNSGGVGLFISTSDTTTDLLLVQLALNAANNFAIVAAYYTGSYTQVGSNWSIYGNEIYVRITRDGSNNVNFYWSINGKTWFWIGTQASRTFTVAKIGFRFFAGNASYRTRAAVDWLRTST